MPTLSMFYGIIVRMYAENGGQHNQPHLHAGFGGQEVVMSLDGTVIDGEIPRGKKKLLLALFVCTLKMAVSTISLTYTPGLVGRKLL